MNTSCQVLTGDALERLRTLPAAAVHCCITSPPYYGLRDYGVDGQIGLEDTPEAYVGRLVAVFREVRRVLRDDGTLWLNLGDSYASTTANNGGYSEKSTLAGFTRPDTKGRLANDAASGFRLRHGVKLKDLLGIPWRVAFALQADGWWLRSDIIWAKPNPMPESVTDRPTRSHEYVFLLSKSARYQYDAAAIAEPSVDTWKASEMARRPDAKMNKLYDSGQNIRIGAPTRHSTQGRNTRNKRDVWTVATEPYADAHFAVFPEALVEPMVLAGCPVGGTVLDPFAGSGTTLAVANRLGRHAIGIELNADYVTLIHKRCQNNSWVFQE